VARNSLGGDIAALAVPGGNMHLPDQPSVGSVTYKVTLAGKCRRPAAWAA
jgi:hypothetical protein